MYRSLLGKQTQVILRSRSHSSASTRRRRLLEQCSSIKNNSCQGKLMSTVSKSDSKNGLHWGYLAGSGILFAGCFTVFMSNYNDNLRKNLESIPGAKYLLDSVLKDKPNSSKELESGVALNMIDVPTPSQIDFAVESTHSTVKKEEGVQEVTEIEVESDVKQDEIVVNEAESVVSEDKEEEILVSENENVVLAVEEISSESLLKQQQLHLLTTEYENLRIIVDDAITTKTSAAGMLHGYMAQFGQALLLPKEDPAYESIWEAISALEHSVKEGSELVCAKEAEVNSQMKNISSLVDDVRKHGFSDIADKTEDLIISCRESFVWGESQIELLNTNLNTLHGFKKRLAESPEELQKYLQIFVSDLIKLLNTKQIDVGNLTNDDALLLLSLRRPELIYAEVEVKEREQILQFEVTLQQEKELVIQEASEHLKNIVEKLELHKVNELKQKIEEVNEIHENHLQEKLKIQHYLLQEERREALIKQQSELTEQHKAELELKLDEKEEKHYHELNVHLSSLRGIESKIDNVLHIDEKVIKNQNVWAAVHALNSALNDISDNGRTRNLSPEISNVLECYHNDETLSTIAATIPETAANKGVVPEGLLMQKFSDIKNLCKKVAMVKDRDGSALVYIFSYIKSLFVISRFYQKQIGDNVDLATLGPYEILEKADYYIQQGDLEQAAKFMSQLKGVPRNFCEDWLQEVRLLLETKQSANLLTAYTVGLIVGGFE